MEFLRPAEGGLFYSKAEAAGVKRIFFTVNWRTALPALLPRVANFRLWFCRPDIAACCAELEHGFYHLDGKGQIPHLDHLLAIPGLKGVQWIAGAGQPATADPTWWPLLKRIRDQVPPSPADLLELEMKRAVAAEEYERAAELRDQLRALADRPPRQKSKVATQQEPF